MTSLRVKTSFSMRSLHKSAYKLQMSHRDLTISSISSIDPVSGASEQRLVSRREVTCNFRQRLQ